LVCIQTATGWVLICHLNVMYIESRCRVYVNSPGTVYVNMYLRREAYAVSFFKDFVLSNCEIKWCVVRCYFLSLNEKSRSPENLILKPLCSFELFVMFKFVLNKIDPMVLCFTTIYVQERAFFYTLFH